jgi:glutaredoxin
MDYEYKLFGKDFTREELMETFPGARTFPQIIVDGQKIGGYTELKELTSVEL